MIEDDNQGGKVSSGEALSPATSNGAPPPPAEAIGNMTLAEVLATPLGDLVRMLFDGAPARPRPAPKLDIEAARERGREEARRQLQRMRRGRV